MYNSIMRRAALRALTSRPAPFASTSRTFVSRSVASKASRAQWQPISFRRGFADQASPTDAATTGETVPENENTSPAESESVEETVQTEPTETEQKDDIREGSVATSETADASTTTRSAAQKVKEGAQSVADMAAGAASAVSSQVTGQGFGGRNSGSTDNPGAPSKILYIGNLFFEVTAENLEREFAPYGNIVNSKIATDANGLSKGFGYIEYDDIESATTAIKNLDQQVFEGRRMAVQYHVRRARQNVGNLNAASNPPSKTLFIGNMSFQMSDKDLNDLFREIRNVLDVRVAIDRRTGQPRGFAHADFVDVASAEKAKTILENKSTYGRQLRVDFSKSSAMTRHDTGLGR